MRIFQSQITNQLANFEVNPDTITSATCEEANCEAGNPGKSAFVLFCYVLWCVQYVDSAIRILHLNLV